MTNGQSKETKYTLENTEGAMTNGQSKEIVNKR
jgi:hypothetical protein